MSDLISAIFPGRYVQGAGALATLPEELSKLGRRPFVIGSERARRIVREGADDGLDAATFEPFGGESSDREIGRLAEAARRASSDVVAGAGGGKAIDTAKAVAHAIGAPVAIVPTIASTDAPTSAVAVIYADDGIFERYLFLPRNPDLVLVDTAVIAEAPVRFLVAGMGDALSTWFEAEACRRSGSPNMTGRRPPVAARAITRLCYDVLLADAVQAKADAESGTVTPAVERVVEANTLLSGLGFESGGLAAAHAIHNGLTALAETHHIWHGEKVAFGVLAELYLRSESAEQVAEVYALCESIGLPTTLAALGLPEPTDDQLRRVAVRATAAGETVYHEPVEVTPGRVARALRLADAEGRRRLATAGAAR